MYVLILILAWITPAAIAGALGWHGIWGSGSAFAEYLIPIPVAGGALHVPSFVAAAAVIFVCRNATGTKVRFLPVLAFSALAVALSLMLEFDRLQAWLFTDYQPFGSPFRLDGNPLLLFVATDAFWVGAYALLKGWVPPARSWLVLPLVPAAIIGLSVINYQISGPVFERGGPMYSGVRGEEIIMVYTSASYDEELFLNWLKQNKNFARPWLNVNTEHVAVLFTNSMQVIKWRQYDQIAEDGTIATVCLYEEDRSIIPHAGYYDCFADHPTVDQELAALVASNSTGLGTDIDHWYARLLLCEGIDISDTTPTDVARINLCQAMARGYSQTVKRFTEKYGENSEQVDFIRAEASNRGLTTQ
ncbi:MAG: hypothetical protein RBR22_14000 [Desulfuromonas sp.]|nr:hypothetical protein [Desulfuromonas sp.]